MNINNSIHQLESTAVYRSEDHFFALAGSKEKKTFVPALHCLEITVALLEGSSRSPPGLRSTHIF